LIVVVTFVVVVVEPSGFAVVVTVVVVTEPSGFVTGVTVLPTGSVPTVDVVVDFITNGGAGISGRSSRLVILTVVTVIDFASFPELGEGAVSVPPDIELSVDAAISIPIMSTELIFI
jgi:hypothetical protein